MQSLNLVLLMVAVGCTSACKYFCRPPGTSEYKCCDDENPLFNNQNLTEIAEEPVNTPAQAPSRCFYYCAYDGQVYCCGDDSVPIPANHDMHEGRCPEEEEQICKSTGIFLNSKKSQGKVTGAIRLVSGAGKEQATCASDGYCAAEQKCCPSKCARKHICMKSIDE